MNPALLTPGVCAAVSRALTSKSVQHVGVFYVISTGLNRPPIYTLSPKMHGCEYILIVGTRNERGRWNLRLPKGKTQ